MDKSVGQGLLGLNSTLRGTSAIKHQSYFTSTVYLAITCIIGVSGNVVAVFIYGRTFETSVYRFIILNIAIVDLLFCGVGIPFNIIRTVRSSSFPGKWTCIMGVSIVTLLVLYSANLIMLLTVYRFRKVCMPMKLQVNFRSVKYLLVVCFLLAITLASPQMFLDKFEAITLERNATENTCVISLTDPTLLSTVYDSFCLAFFVTYTVIFIILYALIGKSIYNQNRKNKNMASNMNKKRKSHKTTKVAFAVSTIFAVSYIPVYIIQITTKYINQNSLSELELSLLRIAERLYVLNHIANPFVYSMFDNRFRHHFKIFLPYCRRRET